ncbi:ABC transporter permease [Sporosarcina sp. Te-1]|uniref:ABC transporter permease n=1 Tax=Sporosarcina sp. Te-1 TaxID=2818390 RepID=UPI001A9D220B|nr:ABC transporter permease [Sporosarcina sp. Te-1]QTD42078.1 ABC transporter permease [Sporosarcina sp. Te-1]
MLTILRNRLLRVPDKLHIIIIAVVIIPLVIGAVIYFSGTIKSPYKIAFISNEDAPLVNNESIQIEQMNEQPALSTLVMGKYNAFVEATEDNKFTVTTYKDDSFKKTIESFFESGKLPVNHNAAKRGIGTSILGVVLLIALMQGVALTTFYPDDRNKSTFKRMMMSPLTSRQYLVAQGMFTFSCLFVPTYFVILVMKVCFKTDVGFGLGTLAGLLIIATALATAFSLFMASVMNRNISLATSGISILTCLQAGCLFNYDSENKWLNAVTNILPQKPFMTLSQGIEGGQTFFDFPWQISYIVGWIIVLWLAASLITNKKVQNGIH